MISTLLIESDDFLGVLDAPHKFVDIIEKINQVDANMMLNMDSKIDDIYEKIYRNRSNEDIRLISLFMDKGRIDLVPTAEFSDSKSLVINSDNEPRNLREAYNSPMKYNVENPFVLYSNRKDKIRFIQNKTTFQEVFLLGLSKLNDMEDFVFNLEKVFDEIIFDVEIVESMRKMSAGFEVRRLEILYHLFCLEVEMPKIIKSGIRDYDSIGKALTLNASPERSRSTVKKKLIKVLEGVNINCELHTKLERIGSKAPDRIYFCPLLPEEINNEDYVGKIYIYKITKHV